jgi:transposase-like protein
MTANDRQRRLTQAQSANVLRSAHLRGLSEAGAARLAALAEADVQLERIARLLHDALQGGVSISEVSRATGVSRQTLYELRARYGDTRDLRLAVLQGCLTQWEATIQSLAEQLKRPEAEISSIVDELLEHDLVCESPGEAGLSYAMTQAGLTALEGWVLADDPSSAPIWGQQ